jgi:hypothetical protein
LQTISPKAPQLSPDRATIIRTLAPVYFYFLVAGTATVMLGPLLPQLMEHWRIQDAQAGTLFTADFVGQLCGAWIAAHNLRASLVYGSILAAAGCLARLASARHTSPSSALDSASVPVLLRVISSQELRFLPLARVFSSYLTLPGVSAPSPALC